MKISEAVAMLIKAAEVHGDVEVRIYTLDEDHDPVEKPLEGFEYYGRIVGGAWTYNEHVELK